MIYVKQKYFWKIHLFILWIPICCFGTPNWCICIAADEKNKLGFFEGDNFYGNFVIRPTVSEAHFSKTTKSMALCELGNVERLVQSVVLPHEVCQKRKTKLWWCAVIILSYSSSSLRFHATQAEVDSDHGDFGVPMGPTTVGEHWLITVTLYDFCEKISGEFYYFESKSKI